MIDAQRRRAAEHIARARKAIQAMHDGQPEHFYEAMGALNQLEALVEVSGEFTASKTPQRTINGQPFDSLPKEEREHIEFAERMGW